MELIVVERRADQKFYPPGGRLRGTDHDRAVSFAHALRCEEGLSYRKTQAALSSLGIRRSLGQVFSDIRRYRCDHCRQEGENDA